MSDSTDRINGTTPEDSEQEASGAVEPAVVADRNDSVAAQNASPGEGNDDTARLVAERNEYLDTLQRLQAEFENFRKRTVRERADEAVRARGEVVSRLLPVLDAFDATGLAGRLLRPAAVAVRGSGR